MGERSDHARDRTHSGRRHGLGTSAARRRIAAARRQRAPPAASAARQDGRQSRHLPLQAGAHHQCRRRRGPPLRSIRERAGLAHLTCAALPPLLRDGDSNGASCARAEQSFHGYCSPHHRQRAIMSIIRDGSTSSARTRAYRRPLPRAGAALIVAGVLSLAGCAGQPAKPSTTDLHAGARASFIAQDYQRTLALVEPEALKGTAWAQYTLGYMYYYGRGIILDRGRAYEWIKLAAGQGYVPAKAALRRLPPPEQSQDVNGAKGTSPTAPSAPAMSSPNTATETPAGAAATVPPPAAAPAVTPPLTGESIAVPSM